MLKLKCHHVVTNRPNKTLHCDEPISCRVLLHVASVVEDLPDNTMFPIVFICSGPSIRNGNVFLRVDKFEISPCVEILISINERLVIFN